MKRWKRSKKFCNHHIVNRCRGGNNKPENLLRFDTARERAWHTIFYSLSIQEVIMLLSHRDKDAWEFLFRDKNDDEIVHLLSRVCRAKKRSSKNLKT